MDGWRTDMGDREPLRIGGGVTPYFAFIGSFPQSKIPEVFFRLGHTNPCTGEQLIRIFIA